MSGITSYHAGLAAEQSVANHYRRSGFRLRSRRWRGSGGEIDLIMQDGETLIFVEVKKGRNVARAAERISMRQTARIYDAATEFLAGEPNGISTDMRFDVALVDGAGAVNIVENAFGH